MKKVFILFLLFIWITSASFAQQRGDVVFIGEEPQVFPVFDYNLFESRLEIRKRVETLGVPAWLVNLLVNVEYPVKGYSVTYWTLGVNPENPDDQEGPLVQATGLVIIPENTGGALPLALYCHGTIFGGENIPSQPDQLKEEFIAALGYAGQGYLTVLPDYVGYGPQKTTFHPYLDARTQAAASIDLMRAGRQIANYLNEPLSGEVFIAGHSQGGHAGLATLRSIAQDFPHEFNVKFAGLSSGSYDLSETQYNYVFGNPDFPGEELTLLVLAGCQVAACTSPSAFDFCDTDQVLEGEFIGLYEELILGQDENARELIDGPWTKYFQESYLNGLDESDLREVCLARNNVFDWRNLYKTTFYYCEPDERVSFQNSIKARDVQRDNVPWYLFWLKWQIDAFNSGNFDHLTCALPSLYFGRIAFDLNKSRSKNDKSVGDQVQYVDTEVKVSPFLFFDAEVDFSPIKNKLTRIVLLDLNDQPVRSWDAKSLQSGLLTMERGDLPVGLYGLIFYAGDEAIHYAGISVQDPELAVSSLYDPISPNPMQREATLDLTLLEETVEKVSIYDEDGLLLWRIEPDVAAQKIKLERGSLPSGEYIVEVRTGQQSYFLPLEMIPIPEEGMLVAPNPILDKAYVDLTKVQGSIQAIQLYSAQGQLLRSYTDIAPDAEWFEVDRESLPSGMYLLEIKTTQGKKVAKLIMR